MDKILQRLIEQRNVSAREVARACSIPQSTFAAYLAGRGTQKPEHVLQLARYFKTSMEFILFGEDERAPSLEEVLTESLFEGWLKVKIERAIPSKRRSFLSDD